MSIENSQFLLDIKDFTNLMLLSQVNNIGIKKQKDRRECASLRGISCLAPHPPLFKLQGKSTRPRISFTSPSRRTYFVKASYASSCHLHTQQTQRTDYLLLLARYIQYFYNRCHIWTNQDFYLDLYLKQASYEAQLLSTSSSQFSKSKNIISKLLAVGNCVHFQSSVQHQLRLMH